MIKVRGAIVQRSLKIEGGLDQSVGITCTIYQNSRGLFLFYQNNSLRYQLYEKIIFCLENCNIEEMEDGVDRIDI